MKFDCTHKSFAHAVSTAASAASTRTSIPIFQTVKIEALDSGIVVTGCDGEMWVEQQVACVVTHPGAICLNARTLNDIVAAMGHDDVVLETNDSGGATIRQGASEYRLQSIDADDFPAVPNTTIEQKLTLNVKAFRLAIDSVISAASTDVHRQVLTGVLLTYNGTQLTFVATDSHRLAVKKLALEGIGANVNAVVPSKALQAIKSMPIAEGDDITIAFGDRRLVVDSGNSKVVCQLLDGNFPNWERVVPSETNRSWTIDHKELSDTVKRAMIIARDNANRLRFKGSDDVVMLLATSEERGNAKEELPAVCVNGSIEIAFNGKYMQDAISPIETDGVRIEMTENTRPAIVRSAEDDDSYMYVIMPMNIV